MKYPELRARLITLEAEIKTLHAEGDILIGASIDSSTPGGTARGNPSTQYRLRMKGQKARYLPAREVAQVRSAIERGRRLRKLQREMAQLQGTMARIRKKAADLGLELPD